MGCNSSKDSVVETSTSNKDYSSSKYDKNDNNDDYNTANDAALITAIASIQHHTYGIKY